MARLPPNTPALQLCLDLGVSRGQLPLLEDVRAGQGTGALCSALWAIADRCQAQGLQVGMPAEAAAAPN